jgi:hypothetical protein
MVWLLAFCTPLPAGFLHSEVRFPMSPRLQFALRVFTALAVFLSLSPVFGQFGRPVGPAAAKPAEPEPFSGKGKAQGVMPDGKGGYIVAMLNEKNELWGLKINKSTRIRIKGKAEPDFLQRGLNVQFNAMVDKKAGKLKDPVKKLTIFTESNEFTLGLFPDVGGPAAAGGEVAGDFKPYIVAGKVISAKGNDLFLQVPSFTGKLHVELAKDADIDFNVAFDPNFVANTDDVQATGTKQPLPNFGQQGQGGFAGGHAPGAGAYGGRRGRGMSPAAAAAAAAAAGGAGGAAGATGAAGGAQGGGFGAPTGTPCGLVSVAEASIIKTEKLSGASSQKKPVRGRKGGKTAEKKEEK